MEHKDTPLGQAIAALSEAINNLAELPPADVRWAIGHFLSDLRYRFDNPNFLAEIRAVIGYMLETGEPLEDGDEDLSRFMQPAGEESDKAQSAFGEMGDDQLLMLALAQILRRMPRFDNSFNETQSRLEVCEWLEKRANQGVNRKQEKPVRKSTLVVMRHGEKIEYNYASLQEAANMGLADWDTGESSPMVILDDDGIIRWSDSMPDKLKVLCWLAGVDYDEWITPK